MQNDILTDKYNNAVVEIWVIGKQGTLDWGDMQMYDLSWSVYWPHLLWELWESLLFQLHHNMESKLAGTKLSSLQQTQRETSTEVRLI